MNPRKITSSFSKREKIRRKPLRRRNRRSISLRRLYISRLYIQGSRRVLSGGTTGVKPRSSASWRVSLAGILAGTLSSAACIAGYAHLGNREIEAAAESVGQSIGAMMDL